MKRFLSIPAFCALIAGCSGYGLPSPQGDETLPGVTLAELREYCAGASFIVADDIVIAGRVASSDKAGNFYNSFFIDDGTGGVEIMAGMPDLHASYHPGQRIVVRARGLAVGWTDGVLRLGLPPEPGSGFQTGYFYHRAVIRGYVSCGASIEKIIPLACGAGSLTEDMCGRLVRIDNLHLDSAESSGTWAAVSPPQTGYRKFRSADGADSITVATSGYASFAPSPLPSGTVSLTGILFRGKGGGSREHFILKLRDEEDISD